MPTLSLKAVIERPFMALGQGVQLGLETFGFALRGRIDWHASLLQMQRIAVDSLTMILLLASIGGGVLALQSAKQFAQTGADAYVGGLVALAVVREIAPIFAALAIGARAGTAMASELAHMQVTNQIDALHMMHVRPARYLVLPRLVAAIISLPIATFLAEVTAVLVGMLVSRAITGLNHALYLESVMLTLKNYDVAVSLIKSVFFGILITVIACTIGLNTHGGAKDVGQSAMRSAVWSAVAVILADFILSWFFFAGKPVF